MIVNQSNLGNIFKGFRVIFDAAFQSAKPNWSDIAMSVQSTGAEEEYDFLGMVPGMRELLGEVVVKNLSLQSFTIKNREWEDTVGIKRKAIERDKLGIYTPLVQSMAGAAVQHPDDLLAALLINGFSAAGGLCYTGKSFFNAAHKAIGGKVAFSNIMTAKLSINGYRIAKTALKTRRNSEGRSMKLGRKLILVISAKNEDLAKQILQADFIMQTAAGNGSAAVTNVDKGTASIMILPELDALNDEAWFLMEAGIVFKPFAVQMEVAPRTFMVTNENDSHVVKFQEFLFQAYYRGNAGYMMPELIHGSDGSTVAL